MTKASGRNVSTGIDWRSAVAFLAKAPFMGMRPSTIAQLATHLLDERRKNWIKTRRRTYQAVLAYDLFIHQLKKTQPQFCNVFTNHVASSMHRYWSATFPEAFENLEFGQDWINRYSGEILFAMDIADDFYARAVSFANAHPEYRVMVSSSMGQAPHTSESVKTQGRIRNIERFMQAAGFGSNEFEKRNAMEPRVAVVVSGERTNELTSFLASVTIKGKAIEPTVQEGGFVGWIIPAWNLPLDFDTVAVDGVEKTFDDLGIENIKVDDESSSSAYHVPNGTLFFYDPQHVYPEADQRREEVSTLDVAPFLLDLFDQTVPHYMKPPGSITI